MRLPSALALVIAVSGLVGCHEDNTRLEAGDAADTSAVLPTDATGTTLADGADAPDVDPDATTDDDTSVVDASDGVDDTTTTGDDDTTTTSDDTGDDVPLDDTLVDDTGGVDAADAVDASEVAEDIIVVEPPRHPLVTELVAKNATGLLDGYGEASDWIELHNPHDVPIQLAGYRLTDSLLVLTKFVFPTLELPARGFIVVFASDRTAGPPGSSELHAPFKLSGDGETLYLVSPQAEVLQTVPFPRQLDDISYGLPFEGDAVPLVGPGDDARYRVLAPGEVPPAGWSDAGYDDSAWPFGPSGFGWVTPQSLEPGPEPAPGFLEDLGTPLADSVGDWSTTGVQGYRGWTYGYWNRTDDPDTAYAAADFAPFPGSYWTGTLWDWLNGNPPWTTLGQTSTHPNGTNNGDEHWTVRRWQSGVAGTLVLAWSLAKSNANGGGVTGHVFVDGVERDVVTIAGSDTTGFTRVLTAEVGVGSYVDLAHDPLSPNGGRSDNSDASTMTLRAWLVSGQSDALGTLLTPEPPGGGLLVRHTFESDPAVGDLVVLALTADDAAAAWLNGAPLGAFGAPTAPEPPAQPAPSDRPPSASAQPVLFTVPASALAAGPNVLAVRAWDAAADDGAAFVHATLDARTQQIGDRWTWFRTPTPGAPNGPAATDLGPIVAELAAVVTAADADPIVVDVAIVGASAPLATARLFYRVGFGPEVEVPLVDGGVAPDTVAGDGVFAALIPASAAGPGQMVRWRVEATDTAGRTTKEPPYPDPLDSHQYVGTVITDPAIVSSLPVLHWFVESPDAANTDSGTRGVVFWRGELYDNVRFDIHGQSTRSFPKKSYDVDFNATQRFRMDPAQPRMKDVNLLTNWADKTKFRTTLAYGMMAAGGVDHHLAFPVRVQQNGAFFSVADMVEDGDDRWLERLGRDGEGALYKVYDSLQSTSNAEKKTRKDEGKEDLQALIDALGQSASTVQTWLWDNIDVPGIVGFSAYFVIVSNRDCCHKNYYAYRDTRGTGEWVYLPWDVDLSFGHNWTSQSTYFDDTLYTDNGLWVGDGNRLLTHVFDSPELRTMVLRRIRTLMDELLQTADTPVDLRRMELRIAQIAAQIGADADLDYAEWGSWGNQNTMTEEIARVLSEWFPARRAYLFDTLATQSGTIPAAQPASFALELPAWDAALAAPSEAWIQIRNPNAFAVDVSGARLSGDVTFTLRPGTVIVAGGSLYVAADVNGFRARATSPRAGEKRFVQGAWVGALAESPTLRLVDRDGQVLATRP